MFKTILVPLDGSPESNEALPVARALARATSGCLWLLQVAPLPGWPDDHAPTHAAGQSIEAIAAQLAGSGVDIHPVTRQGDAATEILHLINDVHADLVVMRTHGRAGLERAVFGSVAQEVLKNASIPLVLVRPGERRINRIETVLVPVDGSPGEERALHAAVAVASAAGAAINILEVVPALSMLTYANPCDVGGAAYYNPAWDEDARIEAQKHVAALATRLGEHGLTVESQVRTGQPVADTIVTTADQVRADLIAMSTHGLTGVGRAVLGSVADAVMRTAHCPVLLVRCA